MWHFAPAPVRRLRQHLECYVSHKRRTEATPELAAGSGFAYDWRTLRAAPADPDRYMLRRMSGNGGRVRAL